MDELRLPLRPEVAPEISSISSRATFPLLAGYWAFGQYWGVWVIIVFDVQRYNGMSESRLGFLYTTLSLTAVLVMLLLAPRLQPLPLSFSVPISLVSLGVGSFAIGYLPTSAIVVGFLLVGVGNGLIDVYLNVAAQRVEVATKRPVLQWLHASYALGGVTGAAVAGLLLMRDLDFRLGLLYATLALFLTAVWNLRTAPRERGPEGTATAFSVSLGVWMPNVASAPPSYAATA